MKYAIGIDLGGTGIKGGVVNELGEIIIKKSVPTSTVNTEVLENIKNIIKELSSDYHIVGVGVGSPGTIDFKEGKVLTIGGNVTDWEGTEIKKYLSDFFPGMTIKVDNDANCAGLCEMWIGAGKGHESALAITLGTGLGGFLYWKGDLVRGARYRASELGHTILYPNGRLCACGQHGCTERYVGGTGLEENYFHFSDKRKTGEEIMASIEYDEFSKKTVDKFIDDLASFLVTCKNFYDPSVLIIGGGVINSSDLWWDDVLEKYKEKINSFDDMPIVKARYLNSAGIIGAASLILNEYE
ncbi:MAG: ROK family protein [Tissierellia bacterium]|nr:ROK family protein [Tissierellia bacterium]